MIIRILFQIALRDSFFQFLRQRRFPNVNQLLKLTL
jgi:hypothetical protein